MRLGLLLFLAVALSAWAAPNAGALTRTPDAVAAPHYDEAVAVLVVVLGDGITLDTFEGRNEDPLSLHKYLYCHNDPVDRLDPSGRFDFIEVMTTSFTMADMASKMYVSWKIGTLIGTTIRFTYDDGLAVDQLVDDYIHDGLDIVGGYAFGKGASWAFGKWIGPLAQKLTPLVWQRCQQLGRAAEAYVFAQNYVVRNSKTLAELGGTGDFIPDAITGKLLHEVKNVGRLQMDDQLRALAHFSQDTGRKFLIHVRPGSKIDSPVIQGLEREFGAASRGTKWDIVTDIPDAMSVSAQMAK